MAHAKVTNVAADCQRLDSTPISYANVIIGVRYEELLANTLGTMERIYSALGIEVNEEQLGRAVEKHSLENIPEEKKGEGKCRRKATPLGVGGKICPRSRRGWSRG